MNTRTATCSPRSAAPRLACLAAVLALGPAALAQSAHTDVPELPPRSGPELLLPPGFDKGGHIFAHESDFAIGMGLQGEIIDYGGDEDSPRLLGAPTIDPLADNRPIAAGFDAASPTATPLGADPFGVGGLASGDGALPSPDAFATIPTPGALVLFGVAGLAATRRRR
jgi:hypothetical protein